MIAEDSITTACATDEYEFYIMIVMKCQRRLTIAHFRQLGIAGIRNKGVATPRSLHFGRINGRPHSRTFDGFAADMKLFISGVWFGLHVASARRVWNGGARAFVSDLTSVVFGSEHGGGPTASFAGSRQRWRAGCGRHANRRLSRAVLRLTEAEIWGDAALPRAAVLLNARCGEAGAGLRVGRGRIAC